MTNEELKERLRDKVSWTRVLYMLLFAIIYNVAEIVLVVVVVSQLVFKFATGVPNEQLLVFGGQLSRYFYDIFRFLTFNQEQMPFPFSEWPQQARLDVDRDDGEGSA